MNATPPRLIKPFGNELESVCIGGLTIENRVDRISFYGSIELTLDKSGLQKAEALYASLGKIITEMEQRKLPRQIKNERPVILPSPL